MESNIKKKLRKKTIKNAIYLTLPLLMIIAAFLVCIYAFNFGEKTNQIEEEIYSELYQAEAE